MRGAVAVGKPKPGKPRGCGPGHGQRMQPGGGCRHGPVLMRRLVEIAGHKDRYGVPRRRQIGLKQVKRRRQRRGDRDAQRRAMLGAAVGAFEPGLLHAHDIGTRGADDGEGFF